MDQKGYVHLEIEKDGNKYYFAMPMGAPLAEATDAAFQVFKAVDRSFREALDKETKAHEDKQEVAPESDDN